MSLQAFKQSWCWAALAIAAAGGATLAMAQSGGFVGADEPATGRIVPISPGGGAEVVLEDAADDAATADSAPAELSKHWIGILLGRVSNEMRAQLDLPEDQGVLVRRVVTDSPADQAGIKQFDIVLNMEVVEHVDNVSLYMQSCAALVAPGGLLFTATLNRTLRARALAIFAAENVLRWLPRGTHDIERFLTPAEIRALLTRNGLRIADETGVVYRPLADEWRLSADMGINYMVLAEKPAA